MKYVTGGLSFLFKLWFGIWFYATLLLLYPFFRITLSNRKWFKANFRLKQLWSVLLQVGLLSWLWVKRKGKEPDEPAIYCSNHCSYLDIVFMYQVVRKPFIFMGKKELLKWPLFGDFFRFMDIPVDRNNGVSAARSLVKARQYLNEGWSVAIFPEATIPDHAPVMKGFRDGAFKLSTETGAPIVPISWLNNWQLFSDPDDRLGPAHPGIAKVVMHPVIDPKSYGSDYLSLSQDTHDVILEAVKSANKKQYESYE
mgnify:FL=1